MEGQKFKVSIKVISDVICPWCFIGKRRLEQAIARHSDQYEFEVKWLPFILQPALPREGVDLRTHHRKQMGARADAMLDDLKSVGKEVGINFVGDGTINNTVDAHRLLAYADRLGKQAAVIEGLFVAHFEQGKNIGSLDVLAAIAKDAGLDEEQVRTYLKTEEDLEWVITIDLFWKEQQTEGLPFFVFNDKISFAGGQAPEVFGQVFNALKQQAHAESS
ncbi:DSBAlike thioredoxin domain containing protein [Acanthamoeba castellanii str. Neff]|uniref:DSBAlike thioredoxin domain containing protein n=1 Tax=Acanthamoeba castellanii (strain ATCC 30010 / Neff) TaxID=1257118 RepID=L8GGR2_ACACF|nr:DSBAlike thioredoxin domain containing protein [Acanthamoeba castellanii str. Neff]ELR11391.1 DSBAlike thioredoxin domain containing protein [Acanthamoeba castellanii str. Neff]